METLGQGLSALGGAVGTIAICAMFFGLGLTASLTWLVTSEKMTVEEVKDFIKMLKPRKKL